MSLPGESFKFRFLSFTNEEKEKEKTEKLRDAAKKVEEAIGNEKKTDELIEYDPNDFLGKNNFDPANDNRSLYDRLLEQRTKKQEEHDESMKFSNQIACLDEDDIEYLNDLEKQKREDDTRKKLLELDKKRQEKRLEAERQLAEELKIKEDLKRGKLGEGSKRKSPLVRPSLLSKIKVKPKVKSCQDKDDKSIR